MFFFFYHFHFQIEGGAAGKGNDGGRSTHHVRRTTAQYKKNFVDGVASFFSAEEQPLELPEQSKLRLEDTRGNVSSVISPTTTQFLFFFVAFHGYTIGPPTTSTVSLFKKKLSCTHFTVPKWLERCSYFPFFFFLLFLFSNPFLFFAADTC